MKKNIILTGVLALGLLGFSAFTLDAEGEKNSKVNASKSLIEWKAEKVTGSHSGEIKVKSGSLDFEGNKFTGGSFVVDMTSIKTTDMKGEMAGKLDGHLKSADFFGVEKHPTAALKINTVSPKGTPNDYKVTGTITIKGVSKDIKFYANVNQESGAATADITIDRTDFNVKYGSGSFFDSLGDKTIYDDFELSVSLSF